MSTSIPAGLDGREIATSALSHLPPFSPVLTKLLESLANENISYVELSSLVERDVVVAGHVLRLVNSPLFARRGNITSVQRAVSILGINKLRNIALSLSVLRMFRMSKTPRWWSQPAFNLHSIAVAVMSDLLVERMSIPNADGAFTAGLLHGIGKLMIAVGLPTKQDNILRLYEASDCLSMENAEMEMIGCTHTMLCAEAMRRWKLPAELEVAMATQHLSTSGSPLGEVVHAAHAVVNLIPISIPVCASHSNATVDTYLAGLGLEGQSASILESLEKEIEAVREFF